MTNKLYDHDTDTFKLVAGRERKITEFWSEKDDDGRVWECYQNPDEIMKQVCTELNGDTYPVLCYGCDNKLSVPGSAHIACAWLRGSKEDVHFFEGFDPGYPWPVRHCDGHIKKQG